MSRDASSHFVFCLQARAKKVNAHRLGYLDRHKNAGYVCFKSLLPGRKRVGRVKAFSRWGYRPKKRCGNGDREEYCVRMRKINKIDNKNRQELRNRLKRFLRFWYLRLIRIQATPHNIAMGLAVGVFVGLLPVLPFQTVMAIALAFVLGGSKIAAALGTWISNPLNWVPLYFLFYRIGAAVVPFDLPPFRPSELEMAEMLDLGWKFFAAMMAGGLVVAVPSAFVAYFIGKRFVGAYQVRRLARRREKASLLSDEE